MADGQNFITEKVGPLPLVVWVMGGAGLVFVFLLIKNKNNNTAASLQTNQVSSLAPTEAEAFGTIEQQQQDVTNALTTLGNNQSALGGSLSTLTGIVTQQGADNAASFQNVLNGVAGVQQGVTAGNTAAQNYYQSILQNMANYYNSMYGQVAGVGQQVGNVQSNLNSLGQQTNSDYNNLAQFDTWLGSIAGNTWNYTIANTGDLRTLLGGGGYGPTEPMQIGSGQPNAMPSAPAVPQATQ